LQESNGVKVSGHDGDRRDGNNASQTGSDQGNVVDKTSRGDESNQANASSGGESDDTEARIAEEIRRFEDYVASRRAHESRGSSSHPEETAAASVPFAVVGTPPVPTPRVFGRKSPDPDAF